MKRREFLTTVMAISIVAAAFFNLLLHAETTLVPTKNDTVKLRFKEDGTFKIAQITDPHFGILYPTVPNNDKDSIKLIAEIIEIENPQLVVYTGDIIVGGDIYKGWDDILRPCIESKTPWAVVLGNHDDEAGVNRKQIIDYLKNKPYSVTEPGPENITGVGNYVLEILNGEKVAFLLYCLDSNAYSPIKEVNGFDWFRPDQIAWYKSQSHEYTKQNNGQPFPALAFFHIPLCEYAEMIHFNGSEHWSHKTLLLCDGKMVPFKGKIIGDRKEYEGTGVNSGMFLAMLECRDVMGTFVGHDHRNDYIGLRHGIALGYGRCSGTYIPELHGARLIEISNSGERSFKTWIRLYGGEKIHDIQVPQHLIEKK
ncbi:MAG: metallophosphoesterase family protein [Planctomycetaceae bacterium]|jgi:hypothetical protein|nr:metallophosphoesterase family protein [Planctomycetaceae bacterium]